MAALPLKLIVGLGNPGSRYARTRHNAGWWFVDALLTTAHGAWRHERQQQAELARLQLAGAELWLAKPQAYMNRSGAPVSAIAHFYRITPEEMLIVHDEIDLPPGVARFKFGGGHGGHNGVRDLIAHLGADFWRLRIGVGHPGARELVLDAVLDRPNAAEQQRIDEAMQRAQEALPDLVRGDAQRAMNRLHTADGAAPEPGEPASGP